MNFDTILNLVALVGGVCALAIAIVLYRRTGKHGEHRADLFDVSLLAKPKPRRFEWKRAKPKNAVDSSVHKPPVSEKDEAIVGVMLKIKELRRNEEG